MARVQVVEEVSNGEVGEWRLCFQWCRYLYDDGDMEYGYRFIWRREDNTLQAARGQARLPSIEAAKFLMDQAIKQGWGSYRDVEFN